MQDGDPPPIRWRAVAYYRTENGAVYSSTTLKELEQLHDCIDPHWDTIEKTERINHISNENLTVERALKLSAGGGEQARSIAAVHHWCFRSYV